MDAARSCFLLISGVGHPFKLKVSRRSVERDRGRLAQGQQKRSSFSRVSFVSSASAEVDEFGKCRGRRVQQVQRSSFGKELRSAIAQLEQVGVAFYLMARHISQMGRMHLPRGVQPQTTGRPDVVLILPIGSRLPSPPGSIDSTPSTGGSGSPSSSAGTRSGRDGSAVDINTPMASRVTGYVGDARNELVVSARPDAGSAEPGSPLLSSGDEFPRSKSSAQSLEDIRYACGVSDWSLEFLLWFSLLKLLLDYCEAREIALTQLCPGAIRNVVGAIIVAESFDVDMSLRFFEEISSVVWNTKGAQRTVAVNMKPGNKVVTDVPSKSHSWWRRYFYARVNSALVCGGDSRIFVDRWSPEFVLHPVGEERPVGFEEDLARIRQLGAQQWSMIVEARRAREFYHGITVHFDETGKMEKRLLNVPKLSGKKAPSASSGDAAGSSSAARRVEEKDKRPAEPEARDARSKSFPIRLVRVKDSAGKGKVGEALSGEDPGRPEGSTRGAVAPVQREERPMVYALSAGKGASANVDGAFDEPANMFGGPSEVVEDGRDYSFLYQYDGTDLFASNPDACVDLYQKISHFHKEYASYDADAVWAKIYRAIAASTLQMTVSTNQLNFLLRREMRKLEDSLAVERRARVSAVEKRKAAEREAAEAVEKLKAAEKRALEAEEKLKASREEAAGHKESWKERDDSTVFERRRVLDLVIPEYRDKVGKFERFYKSNEAVHTAVSAYMMAKGVFDAFTTLVSDKTLLPEGTMARLEGERDFAKETALELEVEDIQDSDFVVGSVSDWMELLTSPSPVEAPTDQYGRMSAGLASTDISS
ncbi:unnamed protein product [Thlaspi arvense]|uniref:Uncharacterized protein n=1 Tax=Thlaspi arvense TaxID=13288 RepID=A0AAU9RD29_THLAR|nr:unnamed protein product [Thlaspi arvense]